MRTARLLLALLLVASCIGCDQVTKHLATRTLRDEPPRSYLGNTLRLEYALNSGGFLSLGAQLPPKVRFGLFIAFNSAFLLVLVVVLLRQQLSTGLQVALLFIIAGGASNLFDRVTNAGLVTDFINLGIGPLRTGIFNVADIALTFGVIAALLLQSRSSTGTQAQQPAQA